MPQLQHCVYLDGSHPAWYMMENSVGAFSKSAMGFFRNRFLFLIVLLQAALSAAFAFDSTATQDCLLHFAALPIARVGHNPLKRRTMRNIPLLVFLQS
jgi:hypothetical protein